MIINFWLLFFSSFVVAAPSGFTPARFEDDSISKEFPFAHAFTMPDYDPIADYDSAWYPSECPTTVEGYHTANPLFDDELPEGCWNSGEFVSDSQPLLATGPVDSNDLDQLMQDLFYESNHMCTSQFNHGENLFNAALPMPLAREHLNDLQTNPEAETGTSSRDHAPEIATEELNPVEFKANFPAHRKPGVDKYRRDANRLYMELASELRISKGKMPFLIFQKTTLNALIAYIYKTIGNSPPSFPAIEHVYNEQTPLKRILEKATRKEINSRLALLRKVLAEQGGRYSALMTTHGSDGYVKPTLKAGILFVKEHETPKSTFNTDESTGGSHNSNKHGLVNSSVRPHKRPCLPPNASSGLRGDDHNIDTVVASKVLESDLLEVEDLKSAEPSLPRAKKLTEFRNEIRNLCAELATELGVPNKVRSLYELEKITLTLLINQIYQTIEQTAPPLLEIERVLENQLKGRRKFTHHLYNIHNQNLRKEINARTETLIKLFPTLGGQYVRILNVPGRADMMRPVLRAGLLFVKEHKTEE